MLNLLQYRHWAIAQAFFEKAYPVVLKWMQGGHSLDALISKKTIEEFANHITSLLSAPGETNDFVSAITYDNKLGLLVATSQYNQNIAFIPVIGALTKYGDLCSYGMQDYISMIGKANAAESIAGIVLLMDTPGGTVDGTPEFGLAVKSSKKPIGVFGDNLVASAGMWVASQADVIVGNKNNPTEFGSIGTLYVHENWSEYIKNEIGSVEIIRSPQSTDKALVNPIEPLTDALRSDIKAELKGITSQFIKTVKSGRGQSLNTELEGLFTGKLFYTGVAKENGIIDMVGTLQNTIDIVSGLALDKTFSKSNSNTKSNMDILGKEAKEKLEAEQTAHAKTKADLASAQEKLSALETEKGSLTSKVGELEVNASKHAAEITAKDATIAEQKKKLDLKPAGHATSAVGEKDHGKENAEPENKFETSVDREMKKIKGELAAMKLETSEKK